MRPGERPCPACGTDSLVWFARKSEWRCTNPSCGELVGADSSRAPPAPPDGPAIDVAPLPSFVALPIQHWLRESHPEQRLWRIADAAEVLLRYLAALALADLVRRCGELPPELLRRIRSRIGAPTFGGWIVLTREAFDASAAAPGQATHVVDVARGAFDRALVPLLGSGSDPPETHLLALRNLLAHGGGIGRDAAVRFLEREGHEARAVETFMAQCGWLGEHVVVHVAASGSYQQLRGPRVVATPTEPFDAATCRELDARIGGVLLRAPDGALLDLSPLCGFGVPEIHRSGSGARRGSSAVPELYVRREPATLLYNAMGGDIPFSERGGAVLARFRALFALDSVEPTRGGGGDDFDAELRLDAEARVGREAELGHVVDAVAAASTGAFWLSGKAGMGKSMLMGAIACHPKLASNPRQLLVVAHRFKVGDARCSRAAFLRNAIARLGAWTRLGAQDDAAASAATTTPELERRLDELLRRVAALVATDARGRPPRVIFILDGLDEVARVDPEVAFLPLERPFANVIWVCSGRPEPALIARYDAGATSLFPPTRENPDGGLPRMSHRDIRAMLLVGTEALRYELLGRDDESGGTVANAFVEAVVARAEGLPIYVRLVIEDLVRGNLRVTAANDELPASIEAYYEQLLKRYAIDDLHQVLTPLLATLAVAHEPLGEDALASILAFRTLVEGSVDGRATVRRAIEVAGAMLRLVPLPDGALGFALYHEAFRHYLRATSARTRQAVSTAASALAEAALRWRLPALEAARDYTMRAGVTHLCEAEREADAAALLTDFGYVAARLDRLGARGVLGLTDDVRRVERSRAGDGLSAWAKFLSRHAHRLADGGSTALLQLAVADADDSPITRACERWLTEHRAERSWLRRANRPAHLPSDALLRTFVGHAAWVVDAIPLPGGARAVSGSWDGTLKVWDLERGDCVRTMPGHVGNVMAVAVHPDGRRVLSAGEDRRIRIWDVESGACLSVIDAHTSVVSAVAVSRDGKRAASASWDGTVRVWDLASADELFTVTVRAPISAVALSPEGDRVVAAVTSTNVVRVWDVATSKAVHALEGHADVIQALALSADGRRALSGSNDGTLRLWDLEEGACTLSLIHSDRWVRCVDLHEDGRRALSGSKDGTIKVWDLDAQQCIATLEGRGRMVCSAAFVGDGARVLSSCTDGTIHLWDVASGLTEPPRLDRDILRLTTAPDGAVAFGVARDGMIERIDLVSGARSRLREGDELCARIAIHAPSNRAFIATIDRKILERPLEANAPSREVAIDVGQLSYLAISPDGDRAFSTDMHGVLKLWDLRSGECTRSIDGHKMWIHPASWDDERDFALTAGGDRVLMAWDLTTGTGRCLLDTGRPWIASIALLPGGRAAILGGGYGELVEIDLTSGSTIRTFDGHTADVCVAIDTPRSRIVTGSRDATLRVWDHATGKLIAKWDGASPITACAVTPDGRIVVGDDAGDIVVLDLETP